MTNDKRRSIARAVRLALLASAAVSAAAQTAAAQEAKLEEVTVTATRRASETDLQRTPVSVSAVTSNDIDRMVAKDISGLASAIPGFSAARVTAFNAASFAMRAELFLDAPGRIGRMHAQGTDRLSGTRVKTRLDYTVVPQGPEASRLDLTLAFQLAGPLAQFSRAGLVTDYVTELSRLFGVNLQQAAAGQSPASATSAPVAGPSLMRLLLARIRRWFARS